MVQSALIILGGYLWGAIPSAYLVGRYLKGIDIRDYGSGNVGAANVGEHVGRWTALWLGIFDSVGKGTLPILLANLTDQSLAVQAGVGLAAIAGHNWSAYIGFTGGRGVATAIGMVMGLLMWRELLVGTLLIGVMGRLVWRETALWTFITLLVLPALAYFWEPRELAFGIAAMSLMLIVKRLTANWELPEGARNLPRLLTHRLLWDRDVSPSEQWTTRRPASEEKG